MSRIVITDRVSDLTNHYQLDEDPAWRTWALAGIAARPAAVRGDLMRLGHIMRLWYLQRWSVALVWLD